MGVRQQIIDFGISTPLPMPSELGPPNSSGSVLKTNERIKQKEYSILEGYFLLKSFSFFVFYIPLPASISPYRPPEKRARTWAPWELSVTLSAWARPFSSWRWASAASCCECDDERATLSEILFFGGRRNAVTMGRGI